MERKWLIMLRREKELSQEQLAKEVGITQKAVSAYEKGDRRPKSATAKKIAAALGFDWQRFYEE